MRPILSSLKEFVEKNKFQLITLTVVCLLVYANAFTGEFISDDIASISRNPMVGNLWQNLTHPGSFSLAAGLNTLVYWVAELNPMAHHTPSILLHLVNTWLVYTLLRKKLNRSASLVGALVFTTHPVITEAVSWISGKNYVIRAFFILTSLLTYLKASEKEKLNRAYYLASIGLFITTMFGTGDVFSLFFPLLLVVLEISFRDIRKNWKLTVPFFLISVIFIATYFNEMLQRIDAVSATAAFGIGEDFSPWVYLLNISQGVIEYLKLIFWPNPLTIYHDNIQTSNFAPLILLILAGLAAYTFLKAKPIFFAICWFFFFLGPSFSPVRVGWLVSERYMYLPLVAFAGLVGWGYQKISAKTSSDGRGVLYFLAALLIFGYSIRTITRNEDWDHRDKLWAKTLETNPLSRQAHINMGDVYGTHGDWANAIRELKICIKLAPEHPDAYHNIAYAYSQVGEIEKAVTHYHWALERYPSLWQSHQQLGLIYFNLGEYELSKQEIEAALAINPGDKASHLILAELAKHQGSGD